MGRPDGAPPLPLVSFTLVPVLHAKTPDFYAQMAIKGRGVQRVVEMRSPCGDDDAWRSTASQIRATTSVRAATREQTTSS